VFNLADGNADVLVTRPDPAGLPIRFKVAAAPGRFIVAQRSPNGTVEIEYRDRACRQRLSPLSPNGLLSR
jgi:hypothetical protein